MIKDLLISFSRVIVIQDFKTVTFNLLFLYKPTSLLFSTEGKERAFQVSLIVFSSNTFLSGKGILT